MNRKAQNLALCGAALLGFLFLSEVFLRFYWVDLRIFLSDMGRNGKIHSEHSKFIAAAQDAGVSEKTFNIYFLGGSTMWGVPYGPLFSIPNIAGYRLGETLGGKPVRIINLSSAAKDVAYVRYLAELILREKDVFHPSLMVIYSGHNEFLKFHPTEPDFGGATVRRLVDHSELMRQLLTAIAKGKGGILEIDQREFFDRSFFPFDRHGYDKVAEQYNKNFLLIVKAAGKNRVPLIVSTLVGNYTSWEPDRSIFCDSAQARTQKGRFLQAFQRGLQAETRKDYDAASKNYEEALSICDSFAEVYFRQGEVYQALRNYEKAWEAFQKATDYDGIPTGGLSYQNDFIRSLERFDQVYVVDSLAYLRSHSPNGLLGENLIIDGMHPNLEGYLLMGEIIAEKIHSLYASSGESLKALDRETAKKVFNVDQWKMFEVFYNTGRWATRIATWHYDMTRRLGVAETFFRQAAEIDPTKYEGFLGLGIVSLLKKDNQAAEQFLKKARAVDAKSVDEYLRNPWIRKIIRRADFNLNSI